MTYYLFSMCIYIMYIQILHLYQKDQFRRESATELNSREYSSQAFHERIRQFYHNQRICFLKNLQEFFRIDQDEDYFRPEVRQAVVSLLDELDTPSSSLGPKLQVRDRWILCIVMSVH